MRTRIRIGSGFNQVSESVSGSRREKMRAEGFFCSFFLYEGLEIGKLQILAKKY
jgi:hypothetical protein